MTLDGERFSALYASHSALLLRFFARRSCDPQAAADLLGETFARAFAQRRQFRGDSMDEAIGWLYAIARNLLADYMRKGVVETRALRRLGVELPVLSDAEYDLIEERSTLVELRAQLPSHLAQLVPEQRQALVLRVVDECSYAEVAERLQISEDTARARVSRALRCLRDALVPPEASEETQHA